MRADTQLWIRTNTGELILMVSTHLDDLKSTAQQRVLDAFIAALEKVFGKLAKHQGEFVHCGLRHRQFDDCTVLTDQADYANNLRCILTRSSWQARRTTRRCRLRCTSSSAVYLEASLGAR